MVMGDIQEGLDVAVIGAGPGGYVAAIRAAQLGRQVTLIEGRSQAGGVCLHEGCIPSKALIHAANIYQGIADAEELGIVVTNRSIDIAKLQIWKQGLVGKLSKGIVQLCKDNKVTILQGIAQFTSPTSIRIDTSDGAKSYHFKKAIIATGSRPVEIPSLPFYSKKKIFSSTEALSLEKIPSSLAVVGGGYVGVELGTVYAKLGSVVTLIEEQNSILPGLDSDFTKVVAKRLKKLGVIVQTGTRAKEYNGQQLILENGAKPVAADAVVVAVGRRPRTESLDLKQARVKIDERGFIITNAQCQTSQSSIYAIGDVAGEPMLAHKASAEGRVAAEAICGQKSAFDQVVPAVIFSDPEIATVGLSETEAKAEGIDAQVVQFPFAALGRSLASHATEGFVKIVVAADTKRVLGVHIVGHAASELIAEGTLAVEMGAYADDLGLTVHTHPTFAEAIAEAADMIYGHAIHISPRKQK